MSSWAERVHRRAANISSVVTSCSSAPPYCYRLEKVKFSVPLAEVCKNGDIPAPLLVLILKLDKDALCRRNVFRAPGNLGAMEKLIHFLQAGRLINVDNYSVYTIASVLKQFLRNIPQGVFGRDGERELFAIIDLKDECEQTERLHSLFTSLPKYTQQLLVLLFGTFHVIASNAQLYSTGMTSEALGLSVAPSFIQSCSGDGKTASMKDIGKYKLAPKIMQHIIDKFVTQDIFGRQNYEYYARITGRVLKVEEEWILFQYPAPPRDRLAQQKYALQHSLEPGKTWLQCQCERWGLLAQEESRSTPALLTSSSSALDNGVVSLGVTSEHSLLESCARLSVSLEGPALFAMNSSPPLATARRRTRNMADDDDNDDDNDGDYDDDNNLDNYVLDDDCSNERDNHADINDSNIIQSDNNYKNNENHKKGSNRRHHENQENYHRNHTTLTRSNRVCNRKQNIITKIESASGNSGTKGSGKSPDRKGGGNVGGSMLDDDCDDAEMANIGKRRYRQNKKKISNSSSAQLRAQLQQQQRRYRSNLPADSKSVDSNEHFIMKSDKNCKNTNKETPTIETYDMTSMRVTGRFCNRCRRGLRHSSSCSSTTTTTPSSSSGINTNPNGGGGSAMTMEELRAVNRYAESTKSLSYLPQVHERQTARMRTRSEWFLGPKVVDLLYCANAENTCSNCCLQHRQHQQQQEQDVQLGSQQQQQQQQQQQEQQQELKHLQLQPISYLGGGSTRDMRHSEIHSPMEAVNTSLFIYCKDHQQQQQQQAMNRQSFHSALEHMDTDDEMVTNSANASSIHTHSMGKRQHQQQQLQHNKLTQETNTATTEVGAFGGDHDRDGGSSILMDTNYVGNIRLSNSAESVQYPIRRPSTRRILLGANIPRQYPMRSSLRRHKEKQIGSSSTTSSNNSCSAFHKGGSTNSSNVAIASPNSTINSTTTTTVSNVCHHHHHHQYQQKQPTLVNPVSTDYNVAKTTLEQKHHQHQHPQQQQEFKSKVIQTTLSGKSVVTTFKAPRL